MKKSKYFLFIGLALLVVLIDQFSKAAAVTYLDEYVRNIVIKDFFSLTLVFNDGAAWSLFSGRTLFLIIITVVVSLLTIYQILYKSRTKFATISGSIFVGGIIGNLIDRIETGRVIDFLDFNIFGYNFPIFNLADTFIFIGVITLSIALYLEERNEKDD
ncbi:TPA: signal peptidase II [bacterium]|nr:signal peptidase II [bacterium]